MKSLNKAIVLKGNYVYVYWLLSANTPQVT